jgi:transcriptional regulator EpsA
MHLSSHLTLSDLQTLLGVVQRSLGVKSHYELFHWLQDDFQRFVPHDIVIAAWGDFSLKMMSFDVVSPIPGVRTESFDEAMMEPLVSSLFQRWIQGNLAPFSLKTPDGVQYHGAPNEAIASALGRSRAVLVHGIKDQRGRHDCLYVVIGPAPLGEDGTRELFPYLLPYIDSAFRQIAHLPDQYWEEPAKPEPPVAAVEHTSDLAGADAGLSDRELDIMEWVRKGKTNQEIGMILDISAFTVKNHVQRIFKKLDVVNRAQAVAKIESLRFPLRG